MDPELLKYLLMGIITFTICVEKWLDWLNIRQEPDHLPATLEQYLDRDKLKQTRSYQKANYNFGLVASSFTYLLTMIFIASGFFGMLDIWLQQYFDYPIILSLVYIGISS